MKCIVLGAGVVGVTTAYYLARDGHEVVVIERNAELADEASYANAGLLTPGHALAWVNPSLRRRIFMALLGLEPSMRVRPQLSLAWWRWGARFLLDCTDAKFRAYTANKHRLCSYSLGVLQALRAELSLDYGQHADGVLYLFRRQELLDGHAAAMEILADHGEKFEVADRQRCVEIEPALAQAKDQLAGAIYVPTDESGSCAMFARELAVIARDRYVKFHTGTRVDRLEADRDHITAVVTDKGRETGDVYVLALGSWSPLIARTVGVRIPVQPVKGYSLTAGVSDAASAPTVGGLDEEAYIGFSRQGDLLRVAGSINHVGFDTRAPERERRRMIATARNLFPSAADYDRADFRACLRPQTPEGTPLLGPGPRYTNLYFNTGQGSMGWVMSCGSAKIVADLIAGRRPEIDLSGMGWR